jgi:hypothetical protein
MYEEIWNLQESLSKKKICEETTIGNYSFSRYRRRDNETNAKVKGNNLDSRWVVPYNQYLLVKFDCHINV